MMNSVEASVLPKALFGDCAPQDAKIGAASLILNLHMSGKMESQVNIAGGITKRVLNEYYDDPKQSFPGKDKKSWEEMISDPLQRIRVINDKNGIPITVARSFEADGAQWIGTLSVARHARGQGLAEAMLDDSQFECHDGQVLSLKVAVHNLRAIRLYERVGFEVVAEGGYRISDHFVPQHVMARPGSC